jgi:hypothetical protein
MIQTVVKIGLLTVVLGIAAEDAYPFGHARYGCANSCGGQYAGGSGFQFAEVGGPGGWGAPGCGFTGGVPSKFFSARARNATRANTSPADILSNSRRSSYDSRV